MCVEKVAIKRPEEDASLLPKVHVYAVIRSKESFARAKSNA